MPEGLIKFSYDEVKPGDRVIEYYAQHKGTKRERTTKNRKYDIIDVDYDKKLCLMQDPPFYETHPFEDCEYYKYYIDRRPRRKGFFSSL